MRIAQVASLYESVPTKYHAGTKRVVSYLTEELLRQNREMKLFRRGDPATNAWWRAHGRCVCINVFRGRTARNQQVSEAA
jgi:hypothetical protein